MVTKGLPLKSIGTVDYDAMMGVGVLSDGADQDAERASPGIKIGTVPASAESPFFPAYRGERSASTSKSDRPRERRSRRSLERVLIDKAGRPRSPASRRPALPVLLSRKVPARWMLYSSVGIPTAGNNHGNDADRRQGRRRSAAL